MPPFTAGTDACRYGSSANLRTPGCRLPRFGYIIRVNRLTKQEQLVLCIVLGLLLTGLFVKWYRTAHPPPPVVQTAKP